MGAAGKIKRTYDTSYITRLILFVKSYVGFRTHNYLTTKYKIEDDQTRSQLYAQFSNKRAIPEISRLSRVLNINYQLLWQFIVLNKKLALSPKINADEKIKMYLKLESEMIFMFVARLDKNNIINEDYEKAILAPAIERVAGNDLRNINNDSLFSQRHMDLKREYTHLYYKVAHKYKLLTPGNRALILRLITK